MRRIALLAAFAVLAASRAAAEPPAVVADIPPTHSLVARVMGDLGSPTLLVQPGASPHGYSLRPSEARALQDADLMVWTGESLTPWLADPLATIGDDARVIELLEVEGTTRLAFRDSATFDIGKATDEHEHEGHAHDHAGEAHDHAHEDHDYEHEHAGHDHTHESQGHHAEHDHAHGNHDHGHDGHDHSGTDPHAWLDPENAKVWTRRIAEVLSEIDSENAETYRANAEAALADLDALQARLTETLAPVEPGAFVVFHDAYHYFEHRFDVPAAGAISLSDASDPSPARIAELRGRVAELGVSCVFSEPQFNPGLVESVFGEAGATTAVLDPLGADLEPGPGLYPALMEHMAESLAACAS